MSVAERISFGRLDTLLICAFVAAFFACSVYATPQRDRAGDAELAQRLVTEAQELRARFDEASLREAVEKLEAARAYWHSLKNPQQEALTLDTIADILIDLSSYSAALRAYQQELSLRSSKPDEVRALNGLSSVHIYLGDRDRASVYCQEALKLSRAASDRQGEAEALLNSGELFYFRGQGENAVKAFKQAALLLPDPHWRRRARALINIGYAYFDLREINQAIDYYEQSLAQSRSEGNKRGEALALTAIGGVYSYQGNKQKALTYQLDAVTLFRTIGDRNGRAVALNGLGYAYRNLADFEKSLECYREALDLFHILGNREYEYFTLTRVGKAYEGLGQLDKALEYYKQAEHRAESYPQTRVNALNSLGSILESTGKPREALEYYRRALSLYRAIRDKMGEAAVLNSIGKVIASSGRVTQALSYYDTALRISRSVGDRRTELSILLNLGKAQSKAGNPGEARRTIESSLKIVESLRSEVASPNLRTSYFASVRQLYETYVDLLARLQEVDSSNQYAQEAFAASEKAHARSLLELLGEASLDLRAGVQPDLLERERALAEDLNHAAEQRSQLGSTSGPEAAALMQKIDATTTEYDQVTAQIRSASPRYAELTQPQPMSVTEIQKDLLDEDSMLLEYMLGEEHSHVWLVTRNEISMYELPSRAEIEKVGRRLHELLTANQPIAGETFEQRLGRVKQADKEIPKTVRDFGRLVLGPVKDKLVKRRLLVVPDGVLQYVPFQALSINSVAEAADNTLSENVPLIVDHEIVNEPSASILATVLRETALRQRAAGSVAVFANPVYSNDDARIEKTDVNQVKAGDNARAESTTPVRSNDRPTDLSALPASKDEAEAIIRTAPWGTGFTALDFDANRDAIMQGTLANYRILHFATHSQVDYDRPELSGLVLSLVNRQGQPQDGFLRMHDIYNLKLPVDLVVLSACNTALGKDVKGEGLIGLTRGFIYAGAKGVVASLWKVDDEATAELMKRFYEGMFKQGLTPAAALRQAQLEMWQSKRWHEPYYWAAFVIQGQYDQKEVVPSKFPLRVFLIAVLITVIALGGLIALVKRRRSFNSSGTMAAR
ncbi:MAG TPA: CHAT domain-containing tetratricopeptide repeat protein [Pyrinomonadaceae bacterium]|nr:CHAT domain-containing tetratricopeptide repeat protein [Pyrinomonadaceae bacterium]